MNDIRIRDWHPFSEIAIEAIQRDSHRSLFIACEDLADAKMPPRFPTAAGRDS